MLRELSRRQSVGLLYTQFTFVHVRPMGQLSPKGLHTLSHQVNTYGSEARTVVGELLHLKLNMQSR